MAPVLRPRPIGERQPPPQQREQRPPPRPPADDAQRPTGGIDEYA
jgi:hypothetical protein